MPKKRMAKYHAKLQALGEDLKRGRITKRELKKRAEETFVRAMKTARR